MLDTRGILLAVKGKLRWYSLSRGPEEVRAMKTLSAERCVACRRDSPGVTEAEIAELRREIPDWELLERDGIARLQRLFPFPSFADALAFANQVGALAEEEGHHPTLLTEWGRVTVESRARAIVARTNGARINRGGAALRIFGGERMCDQRGA
jgi:4a-hydroxytetrahydrobiopterin dehydratase